MTLVHSTTGVYYLISEQLTSRECLVVFDWGIGVKNQIIIKMGKVLCTWKCLVEKNNSYQVACATR